MIAIPSKRRPNKFVISNSYTFRYPTLRGSGRSIAVDTETTGLFIHKGCKPFLVTACDDRGRQYLWKFPVDPFTRNVHYSISAITDIKRTLLDYDNVVFHNANFDLQAFDAMRIPWQWFFDNFEVHDTMVMSHAYNSSNRHGLKELAVLLCDISDSDESLLSEVAQAARRLARKYGWVIADKNELHETLLGTKNQHYKCDYWIPYQLARELNYEDGHPWLTACDKYAGLDALRTMAIYQVLEELLQNEHSGGSQYKPFGYEPTGTLYDKYQESRQLILPILDMQAVGIPVKPRALHDSRTLYQQRQEESLAQLRLLAKDDKFNPRSHIQLGKVLFDTFKFKPTKFGKSGPSTDKDVITKLLTEVQLIPGSKIPDRYKFLVTLKEYRKETTTLQYLNNYETHSQPTKKRPNERVIQPFFSQTRTGTSRLSCTDPNTTNVGKKDMSNPFADDKDKVRATLFSEILGIDDDHRFSLRDVFGPVQGNQWTCIDYDQFQLRIFAVVSESDELLAGFERGDDIHQLVAKIIFNKDEISDVERTAAKAINFGLLFGAGPAKIELLAGVPGLYNRFMANFPKAKTYLDTQSRLARQYGYVHTVCGYRLYVPRNAPHAASCYVIQGTEAQIVRRAMVHLRHHYEPSNPYKLLMMVHDELVFQSVAQEPTPHLGRIMNIMEQCGKDLGIPCKVDAKITTTHWANRSKLVYDREALSV